MKTDASRDTFHAEKHYRLVRMQQGRVQLDADWNEQGEMIDHRVETETRDVVGLCGAPIENAGFKISAPTTTSSDFLIGAGRFYADGLLCINETPSSYLTQPDLPSPSPIVDAGLYLVYLDVWQRHITALHDPSIRETALGGPDTSTRAKIVWQVKWLSLGSAAKGTCVTKFAAYDQLIAPPTGKLTARARKEQTSTSPCIVPPGAGYRGLENQLYRVEIHDAGSALDVGKAAAPFEVTRVANTTNQVTFTTGSWKVGQAVEFISTSSKNPMNGSVARVTALDSAAKTLTLDIDVSAFDFKDVRLRPVDATFKWSRDNGSVVTAIENIDGFEVTVHDLGPDDVLGFDVGQWVEVVDDVTDLNGRPGLLALITKKDKAINLLTLNVAPPPLPIKAGKPDLSAHPQLRRWDGVGAVKFEQPPVDEDDLELESGVLIRFSDGTYRTGDYWMIPARTATADAQSGNIEWPSDPSTGDPVAQARFGIGHHFCRLAMLHWDTSKFDVVEDCRVLFPPLTELTTFVYISGDGQEAVPNQPIDQPLQAGVFNGSVPIEGAPVRFVADGNGRVAATKAGLATSTTNTLATTTGPDGIATCFWQLDPDVTKPSQKVIATWLDADANALAAIPFNGNLSIADQVFYDPANCQALVGQTTVQKAIRQLSQLVSLYEVSGNDQIIVPGVALEPLVVRAASPCGSVANRKVHFQVVSGDAGTVVHADTTTMADGTATATWTPDETTPHQVVEATLVDDPANSTAPPTTVRFTANNQKELGVRILRVVTADDAVSLANDTVAVITRIMGGIIITCDRKLDPISAGPAPDVGTFPIATPEKPTCFVTIDLPYPLDESTRRFWDLTDIVGFQPLILACRVVVKEKEIHWQPTEIATKWLLRVFSILQTKRVTDRLLAHLTAKGNFILSTDKDPLLLDGEAFGTSSDAKRIDVALPSGDDRKGGDFEMWFWLKPAG